MKIVTQEEWSRFGVSSVIHRRLFVVLMMLKVFGNPGYMVPCNEFTKKYKDQLLSGDELWPTTQAT